MKRISLAVLLAFLLCLLSVPALAVEAEFHYLDSSRDVVIYVSWPSEQPSVTFLAPNGEVYDPLQERSDTVTVTSDTEMYYVIYGAPAGQWYVDYNKRGNDYLDIAMFDYQQAPVIESFTLGQISGSTLPVEFLVTHAEDRTYQYTISAVVEASGEEKELRSSSAVANRQVSLDLRLDDLASYSAYMLKLYVWYTEDDTDLFDQVYSEPFRYDNPSASAGLEDFVCAVEPDTALVYLSWPEIDRQAEQVLAALFEDSADEPAVYNTFPAENGGAQLSYDPGASRLRVELSVMTDGIYGPVLSKTIDLSGCAITLEDLEATNRIQLVLTYRDMSRQSATVTVNGNTTDLVLNGDGSISITLQDGWNDVVAAYTDAGSGVTWQLTRQVYVDREPPVLTLSESYDGMVTSADHIEITGTVRDGDSVTVNGSPAELDSTGAFRHTLSLQSGENQLEVSACDSLGNESRYTAVVISTAGGYSLSGEDGSPSDSGGSGGTILSDIFRTDSYLWIIGTAVLCLLVVLYALIFWRRRTGGNER